MSIFKRISGLMSGNKNKALEEEINQFFKAIEDEMAQINVESSKIETEKIRIKRELDECSEEIRKIGIYIKKAQESQNDGDARLFLSKKETLEETEKTLKNKYDNIVNRYSMMIQSKEDLISKINELKAKKDSINLKMEKAKMQEKMNEVNSNAFVEMENRANRMLDEAEAMAELNEIERGNL